MMITWVQDDTKRVLLKFDIIDGSHRWYFRFDCCCFRNAFDFVVVPGRVVTGLEEWPESYNENTKQKGFDHGGKPLQSLYVDEKKEKLRIGQLRYVVAQFISPTLSYRELVELGVIANAPCERE
jgi:hypothetical protein